MPSKSEYLRAKYSKSIMHVASSGHCTTQDPPSKLEVASFDSADHWICCNWCLNSNGKWGVGFLRPQTEITG
jgi:hypothetical protein